MPKLVQTITDAYKNSIPQPEESVNTFDENSSDNLYSLGDAENGDVKGNEAEAEPTDREILAMALEGAVQSEEYKKERRGRRSLRFLSYFNISNSVASSMTVTPSSLALVSLDPAASPATT